MYITDGTRTYYTSMFFFSESDDYKSDVPDFCQSISFFFFHSFIDVFPCFCYYSYYYYFFTVTVTILIYGPVNSPDSTATVDQQHFSDTLQSRIEI